MPRLSGWHASFARVAGLTLVSRATGFTRDVLLAAVLGATPVAVAFVLALRLTSQMRSLLAEGAFTVAFQPLEAGFTEGDPAGDRFRSEILGWLIFANAFLLAIVLLFPEAVLSTLAPGYEAGGPIYPVARDLLRVTFPFLFCVSLMAYLAARLGAQGRFTAFAITPVLMNISIIAGLGMENSTGPTGFPSAWAVTLGGAGQVAFMMWASKRAGLRFARPRLGLTKPTVKFFRRLGPAILSAGALQVSVLIDTILVSMLATNALAHLYFADRLYQLPVGLVSVALGTVLLPEISRRLRPGGEGGWGWPLLQALGVCFAVGLPLAVILGMYGNGLVRLLFEHGTFTPQDTVMTAHLLTAYAVGLVPALMSRPLAVVFQARGDTLTPLKALVASLIVNLACKFALVDPFGAPALAFGTSAGMIVYAGTLGWANIKAARKDTSAT
ncbi:murein biosynthesis integral membrane protein MurJ [Roseivivax sp. CAU 1761]